MSTFLYMWHCLSWIFSQNFPELYIIYILNKKNFYVKQTTCTTNTCGSHRVEGWITLVWSLTSRLVSLEWLSGSSEQQRSAPQAHPDPEYGMVQSRRDLSDILLYLNSYLPSSILTSVLISFQNF